MRARLPADTHVTGSWFGSVRRTVSRLRLYWLVEWVRCHTAKTVTFSHQGHPSVPLPIRILAVQEMQEFLYALRAPVPSSPAELSRPAAWRARRSPFVVDIGANIGWFMLNGAAAGGTVAAFEGDLSVRGRACCGMFGQRRFVASNAIHSATIPLDAHPLFFSQQRTHPKQP